MYLDYENAMLERFRKKHAELAAIDPRVRLYALVDIGNLPERQREFPGKGWGSEHKTLYAGSGLDQLEETGPALYAMPDLRGEDVLTFSLSPTRPTPLTIFWDLLRLAMSDAQLVSWVWCSHELEAFVNHLQTLLHARLAPDDEHAWFFFYQPSYLRILHRTLPDDTRRYVFGPCHAWWTLDASKKLTELPGEGLPIPSAWDALPIPADTVTALQRSVMPQQVLQWIDRVMPDLAVSRKANDRIREIRPWVERALSYGMLTRSDIAVFAVYGLRCGVNYDMHPELQSTLKDHSVPLIDRYRTMRREVWKEIADTRQRRIDDEKRKVWHDRLIQSGRVKTRLRFVNQRPKEIHAITFWLTDEQPARKQRLVEEIRPHLGPTCSFDKDETEVPVPGQRITVEWHEPYGWHERHDLTVEGELPNEHGSGVLVVDLRSREPRAVMHAIDALQSKSNRKTQS